MRLADHLDAGRAAFDAQAAQAREHARRSDLHRRTREIFELAVIARDCARVGPGHDPARAETTLAKIATIAGGGEV